MEKIFAVILLISLLILTILFPGCTQAGSALNGSGKIIDQNIDIDDFDNLQIQGAFDLTIVQSNSYQITLSTDDNLISRVLFSRDDDTLKITIEAPASFFPTSLKIIIAMPQINNLNLSGGAKATISGFKSISSFNLILAGASSLNGDLEADLTNFYLSQRSQANLQGTAKTLVLNAAGDSKLDLGEFVVSNADVKLREGSTATLYVNGDLNVALTDASKVIYLGNPLIKNTSITGDSSLVHQ